MEYKVKLEGSEDFSLSQDRIRLGPRGTDQARAAVSVHFTGRFSNSVEGRLIFTRFFFFYSFIYLFLLFCYFCFVFNQMNFFDIYRFI